MGHETRAATLEADTSPPDNGATTREEQGSGPPKNGPNKLGSHGRGSGRPSDRAARQSHREPIARLGRKREQPNPPAKQGIWAGSTGRRKGAERLPDYVA
jgi:hypothetical protein